jgi:hypothetical protein
METESTVGSRFIVDLGDVQLPALVEKQVEAEIQAVVLRALAENATGSQPQARLASVWDKFPGQTLGLWPGWPEGRPSGLPGTMEGQPLTPKDHTLIMKAILDHPFQVFKHLPENYKVKGGAPSGQVVLQAALEVEEIDRQTKERIRMVLDLLPQLEEAQAAAPGRLKDALEDLRQNLANKSTTEKLRVLRDQGQRSRFREAGGLEEGMEMAARILEDGQNSIYSPDHSFYRLLQGGATRAGAKERDVIDNIKDSDTMGAAAGGGVGILVGGIGAPAGAAAGAAGASVGVAIGSLIRLLF